MEIKTILYQNQHYKFVCAILQGGNTMFLCLNEKDYPTLIDPAKIEGINL